MIPMIPQHFLRQSPPRVINLTQSTTKTKECFVKTRLVIVLCMVISLLWQAGCNPSLDWQPPHSTRAGVQLASETAPGRADPVAASAGGDRGECTAGDCRSGDLGDRGGRRGVERAAEEIRAARPLTAQSFLRYACCAPGGSGAAEACEPRQVREEAAVRRKFRVPPGCLPGVFIK